MKLIRRTAGFATSSSPIGPASPGACVTMFRTPVGQPGLGEDLAPEQARPMTGDHSDGFRTTVLPSASGAAIERAERMSAAFHGAIAPTTPTGRRRPIANVPGMSDGITCPIGAYGDAAAWRKRPGTKCIWNIPKPKRAARLAREQRDDLFHPALEDVGRLEEHALPLGRAASRDHAGNAAAAASIARRASSRAAGSHGRDDVAGERVAVLEGRRRSAASTHSPPMNCRYSRVAIATSASSRSDVAGTIRLGAASMSTCQDAVPPSRTCAVAEPAGSQSLERGLAILSSFHSAQPLLGVSDLSRVVGLSRATTHRYVATLAALGYLQQDTETRKYRLGPRVLDLGFSAINSMELRQISAPHLKALSDSTGHTVNMAVLDGADIVYIERCRAPGPREIDLNLHVGSRLPAYCTSMGKVLLAFLPAAELRRNCSTRCSSRGAARTRSRRSASCSRSSSWCAQRACREQRGAGVRSALDRRARLVAGRRSGRGDQHRGAPLARLDGRAARETLRLRSSTRRARSLRTPASTGMQMASVRPRPRRSPSRAFAVAPAAPSRSSSSLSIASALLVWELVSRTGLISQRDLPGDEHEFNELWSMMQTSTSGGRSRDTVRGWRSAC